MERTSFLLLCLFSVSFANYRDFPDYTAQTYPDSMSDPFACNILEPGFLCDPTGLVPSEQKLTLMHKLVAAQTKTACSCSQFGNSLGTCDSAGLGYIFSIAVVNKMKLNPDEHTPEMVLRAADIFSSTLRENWNRGHCGDDVVIFYSKSDNVLFASHGPAITVPADQIKRILKDGEYLIKKGKFDDGFSTILDNFTRALNGQKLNLKHKWYSPLPLWAVIVIGVVLGLILLSIIALVGFCIFKKCCRRDARGNYTPASRL